MKISHMKSRGDVSKGSMKEDAWIYRTEVHNDENVPIRIVWFNWSGFFDGAWWGVNARNKVLREQDFEDWYSDGDVAKGGWIQPGETAVCDPNWQIIAGSELPQSKWSFVAVDAEGHSYFAESEVQQEDVELYRLVKDADT